MTILLSNSMVAGSERIAPIRATLERLGLDPVATRASPGRSR